MAYGLRIVNPSGELVISDEAIMPVYLGRASLVGTTQPFGTGSAATGTGVGGISTLTFNYSGQILPVLALPAGFAGAIYSCTQSGSTWTIGVSYTDGSAVTDINSPALAMHFQSAPTVFVFGFATGPGSDNYGLRLFNGSGQLVADLTRRPLFIRQRISMAPGVTSLPVLPLTLPGILGRANDGSVQSGPTGIPNIIRAAYNGRIFVVSGGNISRTGDRRALHNTSADDPFGDVNISSICNLWLVECAGLP